MKMEKLFVFVILLIVSLFFPLLIFNEFRFYNLPISASDTGIWLKASYAIFENNYPMWNLSPLEHGVLPFIIVYPLAKIFGDVWAINIFGLVCLTLRPIAIFFLAKKIYKSQFFALLCSTIDAFFPSYYEMYAWGGYPNLLGFTILPIAFVYVLQCNQSGKLKDFFTLGLFSTILVLSHDLTFIMFLGIVSLWLLPKLFRRQFKLVFQCLLVVALPLIIYRLVIGGASEFLFVNDFAYYGTIITMNTLLYVFKDLFLLLFLILFSAIGIFELYRVNRDVAVLLVSWLLFPILYYIGSYLTKFAVIDYTRLWFFLVQSLIISTVYFLKVMWERRHAHTGCQLLVLGLACFLLFTSFNFGYVTQDAAVVYYKHLLENKHSDVNSYDVVMWIKEGTLMNDVIAIRAPAIGRYVEGIAHRRVLLTGLSAQPKFLFKYGEYERSLAAETILSCNIMGYSDMFKIKDQTPILFGRTPYIYIFAGDDYKLLGYFSDDYEWELKKLTSNVTQITISNSSYQIIYSDSYCTTKTVTLKNDEIQVSYNILKDPYEVPREKLSKPLYSSFWLPWGKNWSFLNNTLFTDYGEVEVISNIPAEIEYVSLWKQWRLVFFFNDELSVTFKVKNIRMVKGNTVLTTKDELIDLYGVTHALIKVTDREAMRWAEALSWKLVYNNDLFYLYEVNKPAT